MAGILLDWLPLENLLLIAVPHWLLTSVEAHRLS